jgi:hypothetical protein
VLPGGAAAEIFLRHDDVPRLYLMDKLLIDVLHTMLRQLLSGGGV